VVCLLENGLIYDQENYSTFYGGVNPIVDFEHNHVLRAFFTNMLGDAIPLNQTVKDQTYTRNFSVTIPANVANPTKLDVVAFVVNENGTAINVRKIKLGESQSFEEN
jgi:hypothetical protein